MKDSTLTQLFKQKPDTRAQVTSAPGYAVFSNVSVNVILFAAGTGCPTTGYDSASRAFNGSRAIRSAAYSTIDVEHEFTTRACCTCRADAC